MSEHILLSYGFDGKGGSASLNGQAISDQIKNEKLAWVHLDANHNNTKIWLEQEVAYLDPFIIEALLEDSSRPRLTKIGKGVLLILRGVNLNDNADPEDMISIRMWVDKHRIISVRRRKLKAIADLEAEILSSNAPHNAADFICRLTEKLFDRMEPVLAALDEAIDDIEEKIIENADATFRESIASARKKSILFRRYMAPQREAIRQLQMVDLPMFNALHKRHLQESYNQVTRFVEDLDTIRERAQIIKDELANTIADKLNHNMYVLSVIAAIFLPLGFLTGLLGINIGGIPGADRTDAFGIFCFMLVVVVLFQVIVFKKFKWF